VIETLVCAVSNDGTMHVATSTYPNTADTKCGLRGMPANQFYAFPADRWPTARPIARCRQCFAALPSGWTMSMAGDSHKDGGGR
jgi:hypothetical protein